jgi:hypothetical protein
MQSLHQTRRKKQKNKQKPTSSSLITAKNKLVSPFVFFGVEERTKPKGALTSEPSVENANLNE